MRLAVVSSDGENVDLHLGRGKSVFIYLSEDIYTKFKSKPNKEVRDIYKTEEDAYNKMTSDPYIQTCENKENNKNKKIVQQCLDRKAKEDIFKKIGIECDRNRIKKKLHDPKRAFSVTDRNNNLKSTRTLSQFLRDQNFHWIKVTTKASSWGYSEKKDDENHPFTCYNIS